MTIKTKSTPSQRLTDNSSDIFVADTSPKEPEAVYQEPVSDAMEADVNDKALEDGGLIFGKFKTMEEAQKGYKEAERAITRAADLEKELQNYQYLSKAYEEDAIARQNGYSDRLEMALNHDVKQHELDSYALAASHTLPYQAQLEVAQLISMCRLGGTEKEFNLLRQYFPPQVVALVSEDAALYKNSRQGEFDNIRSNDKAIRYARKLKEFRNQNESWFDSPLKEDLINQALEVSDGRVDLNGLKKMADAVVEEALKKYQTGQDTAYQNALMQDSLQTPGNDNTRIKNKKWLTKDEYYKLTPAQEAEKYDLIVEQVLLEKQGKLPRMLTK